MIRMKQIAHLFAAPVTAAFLALILLLDVMASYAPPSAANFSGALGHHAFIAPFIFGVVFPLGFFDAFTVSARISLFALAVAISMAFAVFALRFQTALMKHPAVFRQLFQNLFFVALIIALLGSSLSIAVVLAPDTFPFEVVLVTFGAALLGAVPTALLAWLPNLVAVEVELARGFVLPALRAAYQGGIHSVSLSLSRMVLASGDASDRFSGATLDATPIIPLFSVKGGA